MNEVQDARRTIEDYEARYEAMAKSQAQWVKRYNVLGHDYCHQCGGKCELDHGPAKPPSAPTRYKAKELTKVKEALLESANEFLKRCTRMKLITENDFNRYCREIGTPSPAP